MPLWAIYLLAALALFGGGYSFGHHVCEGEHAAAQLRGEHQQAKDQAADTAQGNDKAGAAVAADSDIRAGTAAAVEQGKTYVQTHPDLARCGLDPAGVRLWNGDAAAGQADVRPGSG